MGEISVVLILFLVVALIISITIFMIFRKISKAINVVGKNNIRQMVDAMKNASNVEKEEYSRQKDVCGMTSLVLPRIKQDYPSFNESVLYASVEKNLRKIFNALENRSMDSIKNDSELAFMKDSIESKIEDLESMNKHVKYDAISFHRHALKKYTKSSGAAKIEVSTTVGYYYSENGENTKTISKNFNGIKKETRYTTEFAYIYDQSAFNYNDVVFGQNCPNCGAPLTSMQDRNCKYCGTYVEEINLKAWHMISYKEDYK